jgi:DNA-binding NtrC family response regulator
MNNPSRAVVLVVDDEPSVLRAVHRALRHEPFEVIDASSGAEALEIIKSRRVDICLSDHVMPQMTGLTLLRNIRIQSPDTVRILVTGQADMDIVVRAINEDAVFRFIHKPWDVEQLRMILHLAARRAEAQRQSSRLLADARVRDAEEQEAIAAPERQRVARLAVPRDTRGAIVIPIDTMGDQSDDLGQFLREVEEVLEAMTAMAGGMRDLG